MSTVSDCEKTFQILGSFRTLDAREVKQQINALLVQRETNSLAVNMLVQLQKKLIIDGVPLDRALKEVGEEVRSSCAKTVSARPGLSSFPRRETRSSTPGFRPVAVDWEHKREEEVRRAVALSLREEAEARVRQDELQTRLDAEVARSNEEAKRRRAVAALRDDEMQKKKEDDARKARENDFFAVAETFVANAGRRSYVPDVDIPVPRRGRPGTRSERDRAPRLISHGDVAFSRAEKWGALLTPFAGIALQRLWRAWSEYRAAVTAAKEARSAFSRAQSEATKAEAKRAEENALKQGEGRAAVDLKPAVEDWRAEAKARQLKDDEERALRKKREAESRAETLQLLADVEWWATFERFAKGPEEKAKQILDSLIKMEIGKEQVNAGLASGTWVPGLAETKTEAVWQELGAFLNPETNMEDATRVTQFFNHAYDRFFTELVKLNNADPKMCVVLSQYFKDKYRK